MQVRQGESFIVQENSQEVEGSSSKIWNPKTENLTFALHVAGGGGARVFDHRGHARLPPGALVMCPTLHLFKRVVVLIGGALSALI